MSDSLPSWVKQAAALTPDQLARLSPAERAELAAALEPLETAAALEALEITAPLDRAALVELAADPVVFFRDFLGIEPWSRQIDILRAVAGHSRVAVRSGHKVSKSNSAAGLALWWWVTRPNASVVLTSSTDDQIRLILWAELRKLYHQAKIPLGGVIHESHRSGLIAPDGRRIVGIATNRTENMGGFSGKNLLFIADEASGIDEGIFDAIEGNRAGGGRLVMFGNPTQTAGRFFDAFHGKSEFYETLHVSSEEAAEFQERVREIPGLAGRDWVEEKRREYNGPPRGAAPEVATSWQALPDWDIRVLGNFPSRGTNSVISLMLVEAALKRWAALPSDEGPLEFGVDVARFGDDDSVIWPRRGKKALVARSLRSMDSVEVAAEAMQDVRRLVKRNAAGKPLERPRVKVDVIGYGSGVFDILNKHHRDEVEAIAVDVGTSALDEVSHRLRDQLWFACASWLQEGGAIPPDAKLKEELIAPTYRFTPSMMKQVSSKDELKKILRRSPDRADALCLAVWTPPRIEQARGVGLEPAFAVG